MVEISALANLTERPHAPVFDGGEVRAIRLALDADERVPAHSHPDATVLIHVLTGEIALDLDEETHEIEAGQLVRFDGDREVSPLAREPSTAVVVLAPTD